jgi:hypothetical protein
MDVNNIASMAVTMANQRTADALGIAVLKKALEIQASSAMALINAMERPAADSRPPHLGNTIDTQA